MTPFFAKMPMAALQCGSKYEYRGFCAGRVFNTLLIPWLLVQLRFLTDCQRETFTATPTQLKIPFWES